MKAHFRTAYLQREIPLDISVASAVEVGDVVTLTAVNYTDDNGKPNTYYEVELKDGSSVSVGDYIVAQSDMTLRSGAVPVNGNDIYNYYYNPIVGEHAVTEPDDEGGALASDSLRPKKGAFYRVNNVQDVIVDKLLENSDDENDEVDDNEQGTGSDAGGGTAAGGGTGGTGA